MPDLKYPIVEQIAQAIEARLKTITTDNGYQFTVAGVARPTREGGYKPRDKLLVLQQENPEEADDQPAMYRQWWQPWRIDLYVKPPDKSITPIDQTVNIYRAEVEKALLTDRTFGGLALDARIRPQIDWETVDGAFEGTSIMLAVLYRHLETDPYDNGGS